MGLAQLHSKPQDIIIYTDGSVNRNTNKSGWDFVAYRKSVKLVEKSSAYSTVTSNMRMEIEGVTAALNWLITDTSTHSVILTDSLSMLRKIEKFMLRKEWWDLLNNSIGQSIN